LVLGGAFLAFDPVVAAVLVRRADDDVRAGVAGDRAADEQEVVLGVDAHHGEVAGRDAGVAVLAGATHALLGAAGTPVAGQRRRRPGLAVDLLGTVGGGQAGEA